jgi:hypothetical protein
MKNLRSQAREMYCQLLSDYDVYQVDDDYLDDVIIKAIGGSKVWSKLNAEYFEKYDEIITSSYPIIDMVSEDKLEVINKILKGAIDIVDEDNDLDNYWVWMPRKQMWKWSE